MRLRRMTKREFYDWLDDFDAKREHHRRKRLKQKERMALPPWLTEGEG